MQQTPPEVGMWPLFDLLALASPASGQDHFLIQLRPGVALGPDGIPDDPGLAGAAERWGIARYEPLLPAQAGARDPAAFEALGLGRVYRAVIGRPGADLAAAVADHAAQGSAAYAEPDGIAEAHLSPDDPLYRRQWALHNDGTFSTYAVPGADIGAEAAWELVPWSAPIVIGILDGGIYDDEPDIAARIAQNTAEIPNNGTDDDRNGYVDDVAGWDFAEGDAETQDLSGHGSNVASIVAAFPDNHLAYAGVCWSCSVLDVRVLDGSEGLWSWVAAGAVYAVDNGADVLNLSLGGDASETLHLGIQYAYAAGVPIVASMGNHDSAVPSYPAAYAETIAVGATDAADLRASPFTWGGGSAYGDHIDLVAPGQSIYGLTNVSGDYGWSWSGTSQAAPHVAAAAGLLRIIDGDLGPEDVRGYLTAGAADQVGDGEDTPGFDPYYGYGRLDLPASITLLLADLGDADGDGWTPLQGDCDDTDASVSPDAAEIPDDGIDQDCSGNDTVTCPLDADGDGYGTTALGEGPCDDPPPLGDCDDTDPSVSPEATESCDGRDDDCDTEVDEDGACDAPPDTVPGDGTPCGCHSAGSGSVWLAAAGLWLRRWRRTSGLPPRADVEGLAPRPDVR